MSVNLPYPDLVFVPLDTLTAEELNEIVENYTAIAEVFPLSASSIGSGAITSGKIASKAVTEAKIGDGAVTAEKLGDGAVTAEKIASGVIPAVPTFLYNADTATLDIIMPEVA